MPRDKREKQVRIRLVPANLGNSTPVRFSTEEFAAATQAAQQLNISLSGLVRGLGVEAADRKHHERAIKEVPEPYRQAQIIEWAALDACMAVNEWLRVVVLEAIGFTAICEQLGRATHSLKTGFTVSGYED